MRGSINAVQYRSLYGGDAFLPLTPREDCQDNLNNRRYGAIKMNYVEEISRGRNIN